MKLTIKSKLFGGVGFVVLLLLVISLVSYRMMGAIGNSNAEVRTNSQLEYFLSEREVDHLVWVNQLSDVFRTGESFQGQLDHTKCGLGSWYYAFLESDEFKALPSHIKTLFHEMEEPHRLLHQTAGSINSQVTGGGGLAGAQVIYTQETNKYLAQVRELLGKISDGLSDESGVLVAQAEATELSANRIIIISALIALIFGVLLVLFLSRGITNPIKSVVEMLKDMAQSDGDLTKRINVASKDEVGELAHWFNTFVSQLQEIVGKLKVSVDTISSSSQELSAAAEESNASMEEITGVVESQIAQKAQDISLKAQTTLEEAKATQLASQQGDEAVQDIVKVINTIGEATGDTSAVIKELEQSSSEIGIIIETITGIAEQTNLLALNAAIEAARAGESGRGFAVVAEEVRKLAENSNQAGVAIVKLINDIQNRVKDAVKKMDTNKEMVEKGKEVAAKAREILRQVQEIASREVALVNEVSAAAEMQASSAQEIAAGTEEQVGIITQISGTATQLAEMSEDLNILVGRFIV
ncbi:MAG: HAMP domain-containing protein [Clostridiales bacterium]|jgi:methyl-accepting chemotaxis protein|nr:HAMP domain-containing protein [Clostridiales bacterium]